MPPLPFQSDASESRSLANPWPHPGQEGKGGQRQEKGQAEVVPVSQPFGTEPTHGSRQSPREGKEGREESVLNGGVLLLTDIHEEGEKGGRPESAAEGLEN